MQFLKFLSLLQKHGLSYAISEFSFSSPKTWTIISNFWNFFLISINIDYNMQVSRNCFPSLARGLSYVSYGICFPSQKMWTIICNLWNFFFFSKNVDYHMQFLEFFLVSKNMDYHMQFQVFLSLLQKRELSYAI